MKIREETQKQKLTCLILCNVNVQNMESKLIENDPDVCGHNQPTIGRDRGGLKDTSTREDEVRH